MAQECDAYAAEQRNTAGFKKYSCEIPTFNHLINYHATHKKCHLRFGRCIIKH
jgi:hypothetical protein